MKKHSDKIKSVLRRRSVFYLAFSLLCFAALLLLAFREGVSFRGAAIGVFAVYVLGCAAFILLSRFARNTALPEEIEPLIGNMTLDLMLELAMPVIISDENDKLIWYNKAFTACADSHRSFFGKSVEQVCAHSTEDILASPDPDGLTVLAFDRFFRLKGYPINVPGKEYCITVWQDVSELTEVRRLLSEKETVVSYIMIDNLDEILQNLQELYRAAATDVALILRSCAKSVGGILKEYEKNKYLFLFEASKLEQFIASKFDILDRVRDVRVGESSLPITVSIGVARIDGTLEEKERAAHAALDMALQRGGDQAVVKNNENMEFYGGRTKTVQKRTKVRARVVANQLAALMSESDNVLIMGHRNPDFDSIASCAGLARLALYCGVPVHIVLDTGDRNIRKCAEKLLRQPEYRDMFVSAADAQDLIQPDTLLVIADVNNHSQLESPDLADSVEKAVYIDHHRKTAEFKTKPAIAYIEPSASSASELVSEILEQTLPAGNLPKDEADLMLAGMLLDTKQFSKNTGVRTFSAALYLRNEGASPQEAQAIFRSELSEIVREAKFESNVVMYRKVTAIATNEGDPNDDGTPFDRIAAAKAADKLLTVDGVLASFALCTIDGTVYVSARSNGTVNVQLILEKLGGGGHYDAAATQMKNTTLRDALQTLKDAIDAYLDETGIA